MALSEKIQLLGAGLYKNIPDELTLKNIPTASELDYVGSEDFDQTMIDTILPQAIEESIDTKELLEIDYQWICRCLRLLNYGPYVTVHSIFCDHCGRVDGEYRVNLNSVQCKALPDSFLNKIVIKADEFIDFDGDVELHLLTMQQALNSYKDKQFIIPSSGKSMRELSRICYMITSMGEDKNLTPVDVNMLIKSKLSSADYIVLKNRVAELTDYGLRAGGECKCPRCGSNDAAFMALIDERFFRPTLDDLREWKRSRNKRRDEDVHGTSAKDVRKHN